jgi:sugar diacid utilization regulator
MTTLKTGLSGLTELEALEQDAQLAYRVAVDAFGDVASQLGQIEDVDELLHVIAGKICTLVGVGRCSIHLRDDNGMYHGCVGHAGKDIDARVKRARAGMPADGVTLEVLRTRAPVIVSDARNDPRPVPATIRYWGIRSYMAVPMMLGEEVIGLVFLDEEDQAHQFTTTDRAIAVAFAGLAAVAVTHTQVTTELRAKLQAASRQALVVKRAGKIEERLTKLVAGGGDLNEFAVALSEELGKPCAIHTVDGRCLAQALPPNATPDVVPHLFDDAFRTLPEVVSALEEGDGRPVRLVGPFPDAGLHHRYLVAPVTVQGDIVCMIVVMEHRSRLGVPDLMVGQRAAGLVALQIAMERATAEGDWSSGSSLVSALVRGNADLGMLRRRAEHLGIALDAPHRICLFTAADDDGSPLETCDVHDAFEAVAPGRAAFAALVGDDVAVVIAEPLSGDVTELVRVADRVCAVLGARFAVAAGISVACVGIETYPDGYQGARQAAECLRKFGASSGTRVVLADDLGPSRLFLAAVEPDEAVRFAENALGAVLEDSSAAVLFGTLRAFFADITNIRACAERLDVHENTIRYRLSRIAQLTGLPITTDPDAQMTARLALLVLDLQGTAPGASVRRAPEPSRRGRRATDAVLPA